MVRTITASLRFIQASAATGASHEAHEIVPDVGDVVDAARYHSGQDESSHAAGSRNIVVLKSEVKLDITGRVVQSSDGVAAQLGIQAGDIAVHDSVMIAGPDEITIRITGPRVRHCIAKVNISGVIENVSCTCFRPVRYAFPCGHIVCTILEMGKKGIIRNDGKSLAASLLSVVGKRWKISATAPQVINPWTTRTLPLKVPSVSTSGMLAEAVINMEAAIRRIEEGNPRATENEAEIAMLCGRLVTLCGGANAIEAAGRKKMKNSSDPRKTDGFGEHKTNHGSETNT